MPLHAQTKQGIQCLHKYSHLCISFPCTVLLLVVLQIFMHVKKDEQIHIIPVLNMILDKQILAPSWILMSKI